MKLSDFQTQPAAASVDRKLLERNAASARKRVDWQGTNIFVPRDHLGCDAFRDASEQIKRNTVMDAERNHRQRMHAALDRLMDSYNAEENPEPRETDPEKKVRVRYRGESDDEPEEHSDSEPEEEEEDGFSMDKLQRQLDAIFAADELPAKRSVSVVRSKATDKASRGKICFCCGNLDGAKAYNEAHRYQVA